jgi:hypothetical protein
MTHIMISPHGAQPVHPGGAGPAAGGPHPEAPHVQGVATRVICDERPVPVYVLL